MRSAPVRARAGIGPVLHAHGVIAAEGQRLGDVDIEVMQPPDGSSSAMKSPGDIFSCPNDIAGVCTRPRIGSPSHGVGW